MRIRWLAGVTALSALVLSGCAESRVYKSYSEEVDSWSYFHQSGIYCKDWALNLVRIVSLEVGAGETIGLDLQPTKIGEVGFLFGDEMKLGWRADGFGFYREIQEEGGLSWGYYRSRQFEPAVGTRSLFDRPRLFEGFPMRDNTDEGHWADIGAQAGLVFVYTSAYVSPKRALNFCVGTVMLPFNLTLRYPLDSIGCRIPDVDLCDDDTFSQLHKKYHFETINQPAGFVPAEELNELWEVPY